MDDRVPPSFTDHQICPLYNNNGHEESGVASVLQHLTLGISLKIKKRNSVMYDHDDACQNKYDSNNIGK